MNLKVISLKEIYYFILPALLLLLPSCHNDNQVVCTMEFRTIVITVNGSRLDSYFTIRQTTGDTIRINNENITGPNTYPVLNDNYQTLFPGQTENFRFIGIINQNKVVDEMFKIRADDCHINYVSGNQQVTP